MERYKQTEVYEKKTSTLKVYLFSIGIGLLFSFYIALLLQISKLFTATIWSTLLLFTFSGVGVAFVNRLSKKLYPYHKMASTIISVTSIIIGVIYITITFYL